MLSSSVVLVYSPRRDVHGVLEHYWTGTFTANSVVQLGGTTITFNGAVTGDTTVIPISPDFAGSLPAGFANGGLAYDISTTSSVTPPIGVCLTIPDEVAGNLGTFNHLSLLHDENGVLIDRTSLRDFGNRQLCGSNHLQKKSAEPSGDKSKHAMVKRKSDCYAAAHGHMCGVVPRHIRNSSYR